MAKPAWEFAGSFAFLSPSSPAPHDTIIGMSEKKKKGTIVPALKENFGKIKGGI